MTPIHKQWRWRHLLEWLKRGAETAYRTWAADRDNAALERARQDLEWETAVGRALSVLYKPLISPEATIRQMAELVLQQARELSGSAHGFVAAIDSDGGQEVVHTIFGRPCDDDRPETGHLAIPRNESGRFCGLRGHALNTGKAFFTNSPREHPAFGGYPDWHPEIKRYLSVPVLLEGQPAGQIALANASRDYDSRDLRAVRRLAGFYAVALQRKAVEKRMQAALGEKEVLLREIHHRVKNNLQVISSLLNLQAGTLRDAAALDMLKESQNRVRSMAMVHEQLHRSSDLSRIDFREYVRNLAASLFSSYGVSSADVTLNLELAEARLPIDLAVPSGLIVQELVSNALKHAFPGGRRGQITVSLKQNGADGFALGVSDDGVGLPEGSRPEMSSSLGLRLVRILAEQVNATVECRSATGAEFSINFPNCA